MPNDRHSDNDIHHWTLDKRFNVGHFLTTVLIAGMLFAWASSVSERVSVLELNDVNIQQRLDRETARSERDISRIYVNLETINEALIRIEDKIDEKADKDSQ